MAMMLVTCCTSAWAQVAGQTLEEFKSTLDPRVFQTGGYGVWSELLNPILDTAASTYNVPRELLVTLGYLGSAFENRGDQPTIEYGYGVMALRQNTWGGEGLTVAAKILNTTGDAIKADPYLNIVGTAAVLDAWANEANIDRKAGLDAWLPVITRYAGLADTESNKIFAGEVYSHLSRGVAITNSYGETFSFPAQKVGIDASTLMPGSIIASSDYGPAVWDPAASCNYTATSTTKDTVVVHTVEGSYAGCISWFKNCNAEASAHYVSAYDGRLTQMVAEAYKAWHVSCYNSRAIGIEHEGYASASSHPVAQYNASGDLTADICNDWGIPKEKRTVGPGILGHIDITNCCCGTHTDPGDGWDWGYYISRVSGTPQTPEWDASYANQSYPSSMTAAGTAVAWVEFTNTGTGVWKHAETRLGTQDPQDRSSPFCTSGNWVSCNRPTDVDQSSVGQGAVGRFSFVITAPTTPGTYTEKYKLVREGVTWFGPVITWTITVTASQGNVAGTVTNASGGAAIAGATVTLAGVGSTTTNSSGAYSFSGVNAGTYTISASATSYNGSSDSVTVTAGATTTKNFALTPSDTQAPTAPTLQSATATGPTSVALSWSASTDNVGVTGYEVRRNGSVIGTSTSTSYTDSGVTALGTYTYDVRAKDAVPNYSAWSNSIEVTTPPNPPVATIVFSDGFNGSLGNWTGATYTYSTTQSHGTYTGGGAAYCAAGASSVMHHVFSRPFAEGKVWGWFYDGKGGWKQGTCGNAYRQALSLRDIDAGAHMYIDNEIYYPSGNASYYYRTIGTGGVTHTAYATRNASTDCSGAWIYFETTVTAGAPSSLGTVQLKVTDGAGTTTVAPAMTSDFYSYGIGRLTVGLGVSSTNESYWDDVAFQATPPGVPTMSATSVLSASQIRWNFSRADNNVFGYDMADAGGTMVSPQYPAAGWIDRTATSWTESGLTANTQYSRKVRAWNGTLNSAAFSSTASAYTLSPAPVAGSVTPDNATVCANTAVTWTAVGGFGAGKVQYYKYVWDQQATHTFDGSEAVWSSGTIQTQGATEGTWYLHVQGFNAADVANGTFDYAITVAPVTQITGAPANVSACLGGNAAISLTAIGGNLTYKWQKDGVDIVDDGHFSGAATASLSITGVVASDVAIYRCQVAGTCGSATSIEVDLSIKDATQISAHPASQKVCNGAPVSFSVTASGSGSLTYKWQKDGQDIANATAALLEIAAVTEAELGTYHCVVTGECGAVVSEDAVLTMATAVAADFDGDCDVDEVDLTHFQECALGADVEQTAPECANTHLDSDEDVDQADFGIFQRCLSGAGIFPDATCAN
jgi:N-acetyl-anhydromuramyl-L-alanine amidase AmpD